MARGGERPRGAEKPAIVLLSLFDGSGMARVGLDDLLRRLQIPDALRASWFAEIDNTLATAVERSWDQRARAGGGPPHRRAGSD
eukprot:6806808-Lingulodinium_polyedra.AAC.1